MIKKLTIYYVLFLTLLFTGCAEEDWLINPNDVPDKDYAEINFAVSEVQRVKTRAGYSIVDGSINNVTLLLYRLGSDLSTSTLLDSKVINPSGENTTVSSTQRWDYSEDVKDYFANNSSVYFFAVANHTFSSVPQNVQALKTAVDNSNLSTRTNIVMIGSPGATGDSPNFDPVSRATLNQPVTIELCRNLARVNVVSSTDDFELESYKVCSYPSSGFIAGGLSRGAVKDGSQDGEEVTATSTNFAYAYPQQTMESKLGSDSRAYVIVKGKYNAKDYYYRVDLMKKGTPTQYFFLTANHEYDIDIKKVKRAGYDSASEAALHPMEDLVEVDIHDHVPAVLSMISDGARELGVQSNVEVGTGKSNYFTLKLFSNISSSEYPSLKSGINATKYEDSDKGFSIEVVEGKDWLKVSNLTSGVTTGANSEVSEGGETKPDPDSSGSLYHVGLSYSSALQVGTMTGKILVTWKGLTREVNVTWKNDLNLADICSAKLTITYSGSDKTGTAGVISDYWAFIGAKKGTASTVMGLTPEQNVGKIRNQGLHFPFYYGGDKESDKWEYIYELEINTAKVGTGTLTARIEADGNALEGAFSGSNWKVDDTNKKITIKRNAKGLGMDYLTGKLIISIGGQDLPGIDIYHTGFFHHVNAKSDSNSPLQYEMTGVDAGWYYYEVRSFGYRLWLDRNICAKAGGMDIIDSDGSHIVTDGSQPFRNDATGGYFKPARYEKYKNPGDDEHLYKNICPPGFRIPNTTEWDIVRNSVAFNTSQTVTGGVTYYQANVEDKFDNMLYFPKVMYMNLPTNSSVAKRVGDAYCGYYWTRSEAAGLEKEQIGSWLRALVISGRTTSYMHGDIQHYGMQVRAIDDAPEVVNQTTIGFRVTGATHVYIYDAGEPYSGATHFDSNHKWLTSSPYDDSYTDDIKSGLMQWPGVAIGDAETMKSDLNFKNGGNNAKEFVFTYTTNTDPKNLRFVFSYVKDGKITVFSRKIESGEGMTGAYKYNGWPLLESYKFGIGSGNTYNSEIKGVLDNESTEKTTYRFYIRKNPATSDATLGAKLEIENKGILFDDNWNTGELTKTYTTEDGEEYYYYDYPTDKTNWNFLYCYQFWHKTNNNITHNSQQKGLFSDFKTETINGKTYKCVTITELETVVSGKPSGSVTSQNVWLSFTDNAGWGNLKAQMSSNKSSWDEVTMTTTAPSNVRKRISKATRAATTYYVEFDKSKYTYVRFTGGGNTTVWYEIKDGNTTSFQNTAAVSNKYLVIRVKANALNSDQQYIYAWKGSTKYYGEYNSSSQKTGEKDGYRYWKVERSSDPIGLDGVIFKADANGDGAHKTEIQTSSEFVTETNSSLLSSYGATTMYTVKTPDYYYKLHGNFGNSSWSDRDTFHWKGDDGFEWANATLGTGNFVIKKYRYSDNGDAGTYKTTWDDSTVKYDQGMDCSDSSGKDFWLNDSATFTFTFKPSENKLYVKTIVR